MFTCALYFSLGIVWFKKCTFKNNRYANNDYTSFLIQLMPVSVSLRTYLYTDYDWSLAGSSGKSRSASSSCIISSTRYRFSFGMVSFTLLRVRNNYSMKLFLSSSLTNTVECSDIVHRLFLPKKSTWRQQLLRSGDKRFSNQISSGVTTLLRFQDFSVVIMPTLLISLRLNLNFITSHSAMKCSVFINMCSWSIYATSDQIC